MRLTKEVTEYLVKEVAGEDTVKLVGLLKEKNNISEFILAEKLKITVNTVRKMLYRLQDYHLVTSVRKKDKKKGWYIYYWTFNTPQARSLVITVKQGKLEQLKKRLELETQQMFFICPEKCTRFKMENAMDYHFKCPECGTILQEEDNLALVEMMKRKIMELEQELIEKPKQPRMPRKTTKKILAKKPKLKKTSKLKKPKLKRKLKSTKKLKNLRNPKLKLRKKIKNVRKPQLRKKIKPVKSLKKIKKPKLRKKNKTYPNKNSKKT